MSNYNKIIIFFTLLFAIGINLSLANMFWIDNVKLDLHYWELNFIEKMDWLLWFIIWLLYFISVIMIVYAWFVILTSSWDDEKTKNWKKIIIYAVIWLIIIFLTSQFVNWIINIMTDEKIIWK